MLHKGVKLTNTLTSYTADIRYTKYNCCLGNCLHLHKLNFSYVYETGSQADLKHDMPNARSVEVKSFGSVRTSHSSENG